MAGSSMRKSHSPPWPEQAGVLSGSYRGSDFTWETASSQVRLRAGSDCASFPGTHLPTWPPQSAFRSPPPATRDKTTLLT